VRLLADKRLGIDTLLTYQLGPSTAVYVGYATGLQNVALAVDGRPVDRTSAPSTVVGRQLFAKVSYLVRP
jgi:hypothetical protein